MPNRVRLVLAVDNGEVTGKVTMHGPYASAEEVLDPAAGVPEASADVDLSELPSYKEVEPKLLALVNQLLADAGKPLASRFDDAKFTARQVGKLKLEIKR